MIRLIACLSLLVCFPGFAQELEVEVLGLFKNAAILRIDGAQRFLKAGQTSTEGVLLISANSKEAVIEFAGQTQVLNLSTHISGAFEAVTSATVSILLNKMGQYKTSGTINGRTVEFLVDTGANILAMNAIIGRSLGIDVSKGRKINVTTASGVVDSRLVVLDTVQIGGIKVNNVQAAVIEGKYPEDILLGMSFLRNVEISESSGVLQLTAKF